MAILSNNGGAVNLPPDLLKDSSAPTLNTDLYEIVITDLEPNSVVPVQFAWVYPDKTVSEYSPSYDLNTSDEATPNTPDFNISDVEWGNGFLKITWNGKDTTGADLKNIKQVNIWMRGGTFGATSVKTAHFFTGPGTKTITLPSGTYYVKLQAETALGKLSAFSNEIQSTSFKKPAPVSALTAVWKKDDNVTKSNALKVNFTFDSTAQTSTTSNLYATFFTIKLTGNSKSRSFSLPVDKTKTSHTWYLTSDMNKEFFGAFPFCGVFTVEVYVSDSFSLVSDSVTITSETYTTTLDTPVITATAEIGGYSVAYNSQDGKGFDQIYIYENLGLGAGWVQKTQATSNPVKVGTLGVESRQVKAIFYDINGYATAESNIVTVVPLTADPTDTTAPTNPTNITASAAVDANDKTGFSLQSTISFTKSSDPTCRGYRIRWTTQTVSPIYEYGYVDHPSTGTSVSFTVSGLIPNITYYYQVASVDQFNNTQTYSTAGTFSAQDSVATAEGSLARLKSYISIGGATGDQFKFGTGIAESINTSTTITPSLSSGTYHGVLLNKTGNKNNFWLTTGQLRVGTDTQFMYFDGTNLYLTGNINAASGTITGNLNVTSGSFIAGSPSSARVTMSSSGIFAYDATPSLTTQIIATAAANGTTFKTSAAELGNWLVNSTSISNNGISITAPNSQGITTSKPSIIANRGAYYVGMQTPASTPAATDVVLWAGLSSDGSGTPAFKVTADGKLNATQASISGTITGSSFTSTNYIAGNGISISSTTKTVNGVSRTFDQIDLSVGSSSIISISADANGGVIFGPAGKASFLSLNTSGAAFLQSDGGAYFLAGSAGQFSINAGTINGAWIVGSTSGFVYQAGGAGTSNGKSFRNIEASVLAPSLTTGAALSSGYTNGEILITY